MKKILAILTLILITNSVFSQYDKKYSYYENGNKRELVKYYDGKLSGKCIAWSENGVIIGEVSYVNGRKDGKWFIWHEDGTPAYKLYYKDNKKVGVWKVYDESGKLISEKQYDPIYKRNTLISLGTFTLSDISIAISQRVDKNKLWVIGGEYSTYVSDGEYGDFTQFKKFQRHTILATTGWVSDGWAVLVKAGGYFDNGNTNLDYGCETLLFFDDDMMNIMPVVGFSITKGMGLQIKFGINF